MKAKVLFITGTDTGVGKTLLATALTRRLRERGTRVAALKPVCSGGRDDARALHVALGGALSLNEINPWHFRAPIAPTLAAQQDRKRVKLKEAVGHVRAIGKRFNIVLVEGAGGLLSPLGEDFDSRDLIVALRAMPIVVCPNRLGAVNQARLALESLPRSANASFVLMSPRRPDLATRTNATLLAEYLEARAVFQFPWLRHSENLNRAARQTLDALLTRIGLTATRA